MKALTTLEILDVSVTDEEIGNLIDVNLCMHGKTISQPRRGLQCLSAALSISGQYSTTGVTKAVVCAILSVG